MHLQQLIKTFTVLISVLVLSSSYSQNDTIHYIESPYRSEYTPHFKLGKFKRGFSNDSLKISLDSLEDKPKVYWTRNDSLEFAKISLQTGNTNLSRYYYKTLDVDFKTEPNYWYDQLIIFYLKKEYKKGVNFIISESPMVLEYSKIYFFEKIFRAQIEQSKDDRWYKSNRVFDWEVDSTLLKLDPDDPKFKDAVINPLKNLEDVLKMLIAYVHEDDPIISSSCREMGRIIEGYLNYSQAYIAYSLGRHYNKRDKELLNNLKAVKAKMTENKYKIPNFRKYFPRIEYWRFEYEVLKEKVISAKNDTNTYVKPKTMKPKEKPMINFPHQLIVIGGLFVFIIILAFFLKAKKSKK